MSKYYIELPLSLERIIGVEGKFLFAKFGAWAETKKEAEKEVREWQKEFIESVKKKQKAKELNDEPFESKNPNRK